VLAKRDRLTKQADFRQVHAQGRSWANRLLVLVKLPNALSHSRFGFSVSRRVGSAVVRNRTKRLLREVIRIQRETISPGWDIILIARQGIVKADFETVRSAVIHLLNLADLLRADDDKNMANLG